MLSDFTRQKLDGEGDAHDLKCNLKRVLLHAQLQKPFESFLFVQDLFLNRKTYHSFGC